MAEEALDVGDVHAQRQQPGGHGVAQQVRVGALGDAGGHGDAAHHLADALPGVDPRSAALARLPAQEQRPGPAAADVQAQEPGELGPDRHLPPLAALAVLDGDHALGEADVLDPQGHELGDPGPGLEQGLLYLETKWASLVSYGLTVDLLKEVLPVGATTNAETIRRQLHRVAARADTGLGDEQPSFIEGCPSRWNELPHPEGPIVVGIDGGFVRDWHAKANHFEVVVGKAVPEDRDDRCFGFVQNHDPKPKRRLFEVLRGQGLRMNQEITFLTDGGDSVRTLATLMSPRAEHILAWLHLAMRLTVLGRHAKGVKRHDPQPAQEAETQLEKVEWHLWNGNVREALFRAEWLAGDLDGLTSAYPALGRFARTAAEFHTYLANHAGAIPNHAERWRYGERVTTSFVESTVNLVVGKRFAKRQQLQWSAKGAHLLVQTRTRGLDGTLRGTFAKWYPGLAANDQDGSTPAAAA
jgi:hypothetical protein